MLLIGAKISSPDGALGENISSPPNGSLVLMLALFFALPIENKSSSLAELVEFSTTVGFLFVLSLETEKESESSAKRSSTLEVLSFESDAKKSPPAKGSSMGGGFHVSSLLIFEELEPEKPKNSSLISESLVSVLGGRGPESTSLFPNPPGGDNPPGQDNRALAPATSLGVVPKRVSSLALAVAAAARRAWRVGGRLLT